MIVKVRKIGNSQGILLPGALLKQCSIKEDVSIAVFDNKIIITPVVEDTPRKGWAEAFKAMAENGDDHLEIPDFFKDEGLDEWNWK